MKFKLRQMEVFRAVMLTGSMSSAAKLLAVSQPSISRLVAYTEQSIGLKLFNRHGGTITPTAEAEILLREVEDLYQKAQYIDEFTDELRNNPSGVLSIASSPSLAIDFVPRILADFRSAYPDTVIRLRTTPLAEMGRELLAKQVDIALSIMPITDPGVTLEALAVGRMVCVAPAGHPIGARSSIDLSDLSDHPMILYSRNIPFGNLIWRSFEQACLRPRVAVEISRAELALALVRKGVGVALVGEFSLDASSAGDLAVRPLTEDIPIILSLLCSSFRRPNVQSQNFIRMAKAHAEAWKRRHPAAQA